MLLSCVSLDKSLAVWGGAAAPGADASLMPRGGGRRWVGSANPAQEVHTVGASRVAAPNLCDPVNSEFMGVSSSPSAESSPFWSAPKQRALSLTSMSLVAPSEATEAMHAALIFPPLTSAHRSGQASFSLG